MPTADEVQAARAELARRELARRAAARDGSGMVGAVAGLGRARANTDFAPERPRPPAPVVRPPAQRGQQGSFTQEVGGALANVNRGIPLFDEIAGSGLALDELISGRASDPVDAFQRGMARQRGVEDQFRERRPLAATGLQSTGSAASALVPVGTAAQGAFQGGNLAARAMGAARGGVTAAAQGAVYTLADRGAAQERIDATNAAIPINLALGGVLGAALTRGRPGPPRPDAPRVRSRSDDVRLLREAGTDMTPGDRIGGVARVVEDALQSFPILGPQIRAARSRGIVSMNVAAIQDALEPIGGRISRDTPPGGEMVSDAADQIGAHLNAAAARIPSVRQTPELGVGMRRIRDALPERLRGRFQEAVERHLDPSLLSSGAMTGAQVRAAESAINAEARSGIRATNSDDNAIGGALKEAVDEVKGLLAANADDETAQALRAGRLAWAKMVRVLKASERAGGDTFSAPQLASAVSSSEASRSNIARARGLGQDFSRAAKRVFGNRLPDSGTADRNALIGGTAALAGTGGMAFAGNPLPLAGVAAGAAALSVPAAWYASMARNIAARVPETAGKATAAKALAELDAIIVANPQVQQALANDRARLARLAGAASANATSQRPSPPR